jgi:hypothetical protein
VGQIKKEGKKEGKKEKKEFQGTGCPELTNHEVASSASVTQQLGIHRLEANVHEALQSTRKPP